MRERSPRNAWSKSWAIVLSIPAAACGGSEIAVPRENTQTRCADDVDNDGDGFVDCNDQDCQAFAMCVGGDSDSDTDTDSGSDTGSESDTASDSDTGSDTGSDTNTDSDSDTGSASDSDTDTGTVVETCNGVDDDDDGLVDDGAGCPCDVDTYEGHGYMFCTIEEQWTVAESVCTDHGYELATVNDADEELWIAEGLDALIGDYVHAWIGLNDRDAEGLWEWISGDASAYRNWYPLEPNGAAGENCVEMIFSNGDAAGVLWNDNNCGVWYDYVCESG